MEIENDEDKEEEDEVDDEAIQISRTKVKEYADELHHFVVRTINRPARWNSRKRI